MSSLRRFDHLRRDERIISCTADLILKKFRRICIVRDLKIRPINHHTSGTEEVSSIV